MFPPAMRIRIRRIRMFLDLLDPDLDPLVRGTGPDQQKNFKTKKISFMLVF